MTDTLRVLERKLERRERVERLVVVVVFGLVAFGLLAWGALVVWGVLRFIEVLS